MRLADWLEKHKIRRIDAATALGVSPARITFLCSDEGWPAKVELAEGIRRYTGGAVMPNDFLPIARGEKTPAPDDPHDAEKPEAQGNE